MDTRGVIGGGPSGARSGHGDARRQPARRRDAAATSANTPRRSAGRAKPAVVVEDEPRPHGAMDGAAHGVVGKVLNEGKAAARARATHGLKYAPVNVKPVHPLAALFEGFLAVMRRSGSSAPSPARRHRAQTSGARAAAFLQEAFAKGPGPAAELEERAAAARIARAPWARARRRLGVLAARRGRSWWWSLPEGQGPREEGLAHRRPAAPERAPRGGRAKSRRLRSAVA
jgi:hypothetical protein